MKTYITISIDKLDDLKELETERDGGSEMNMHIHTAVNKAMDMMRLEQLVQFKITNLPLRREDS